jgi:DNA helicase-2/ATP-dependent DNA helicase PcrA
VILNRNYRCGEEIVQVAEDIISYNTKRFEKKMQAREDAASLVEVRTFKDHYEENKHIIYTIKEEMAKKTPLSQIAILYRTNQGPRQLIAALMAYNIPFYMQDAVPNLFDHWISKNIIDYMHLAMGDRKRSTFLRVMNRPKRYISREYLTESQVSFDDLLEKVKDKPWLYEYVEDFKEDLRIMKNMTPLMAINYIRKSVGYNAYLAEYARFRKIQEEEFTQVLEELQESAKGYDTYEAWFDHIKEYTEELNRQSKENQKEKENVFRFKARHHHWRNYYGGRHNSYVDNPRTAYCYVWRYTGYYGYRCPCIQNHQPLLYSCRCRTSVSLYLFT